METSVDSVTTERAVLAVLAGTPLADAAALAPIGSADLADAVDLYRTAGRTALQQQAERCEWRQLRIQFTDQKAAESTFATHLGPLLRKAEATGAVSAWWFIRKQQWRLRCHPDSTRRPEEMDALLNSGLEDLRARGVISAWSDTVYEPEIYAFGGPQAMAVAHELFYRDSRCTLNYLTRPAVTAARRELSILLCNLLMKAANQDWYERGDIWARVEAHRPHDPAASPEQQSRMKAQLHRLMSVDLRPVSEPVRSGRRRFAARWIESFEQACRTLATLEQEGRLGRGIRDVLAHHILFHWNRLGITPASQATLARAARAVTMGN